MALPDNGKRTAPVPGDSAVNDSRGALRQAVPFSASGPISIREARERTA